MPQADGDAYGNASASKTLDTTTPRVGQRRRYSIPDMYKSGSQKKEKENINKDRQKKQRAPKDLITASLRAAGKLPPSNRPKTAIG